MESKEQFVRLMEKFSEMPEDKKSIIVGFMYGLASAEKDVKQEDVKQTA